MRETQWTHSLHLSLNPRKLDVLICQIEVSGLTYNKYNSNSEYSGSKIECFSFY
jgi:hypothetical protein